MITTNDGHVFENETDAQDWITRRDEYFAAIETLAPLGALDAGEYEHQCAQHRVPCHTDSDIRHMAYGLHHGEFVPSPVSRSQGREYRGYTTAQYIEMRLARLRLRALEADIKPRAPRQSDYPNGRQLDCGHTVYYQAEVMSASRGTSCSDCYDRMSD